MKKYFIIYRSFEDHRTEVIFTIVESKEVAEDWCNRNYPHFYYVERICGRD